MILLELPPPDGTPATLLPRALLWIEPGQHVLEGRICALTVGGRSHQE